MPDSKENPNKINEITENEFNQMLLGMRPKLDECAVALSQLIEATTTAIPVDTEAVLNLLSQIPTESLGEHEMLWKNFLDNKSPNHAQIWTVLAPYLNRMQADRALRQHLGIVVQVLIFVIIRNEDHNQLRSGLEKLVFCVEHREEIGKNLIVSAVRDDVAGATEIVVPKRVQKPPHSNPKKEEDPKREPRWKGPLQAPNHPDSAEYYA